MNITEPQRLILLAIAQLSDRNGYPPTIRQICEQAGYESPGWVHQQVALLEVKGKITRSPDRRRLIQLV